MKLYLFNVLFMVGALLQGIGSAFGAITQSNNVDKTLSSQRMENEKNRQYNLQLAKLQNEWNLQQWERENEYNNPLNQMQRLKAAGLNPNLVYGNGAGQSTAAPSPQLTSGSPSIPQDMSLMASRPTIGTIMAQGLQNEMMRAQIDKVKAETRSEGYQGDILASDAAFRDAINQGNIDLGNMQIKGISSEIKLNNEQITKLRSEISKLEVETKNAVAQYDLIKSQIANVDSATASRMLHDALDSAKVTAEIEKISSEIGLNVATTKRIYTLLSAELLGIQSETARNWSDVGLNSATQVQIEATTDSIRFDLSQAKNWSEIERGTGVVAKICQSLTPFANVLGIAIGSGALRGKPNKIGFR